MTRLLVAEDDEGMAEFLEYVLKANGYELLMCHDGQEAWERLIKEGADLAVLDVNMPRMTGFELCGRIRGDIELQKTPVLMLTVRSLPDDQEEGYQSGADDYLPKPFSVDVLIARLRALERRLVKS